MLLILILCSMISLTCNNTQAKAHLQTYTNAISTLEKVKNANSYKDVRLHLGCGQNHIDGYINIDFPLSEHTIQTHSGADIFADITKLSFSPMCIDEIRSHHTFEHFNRQQALALLCSWHYALKVGGVVTIETPDFEQSIIMLTSPAISYDQKQIIMRHIFGSHEAYWATHYDGWYQEKFKHVLTTMGFEIISVQKNSYLVLRNITVHARKVAHLDKKRLVENAKSILRESMVNRSDTEETIWKVWCSEFEKYINPCIIE